ncbi:MAG: HAMP domain-containing protein [Chloroflexi bacterium]|nr:HAMP domain-containing protein [Chloroflexota bacterium]
MTSRFRRLGIQKRIMLYVTVGLVLMFGSIAFLGLQSIEQATQLVYQERLSTAYTTAGVLERDFLHVARDVQEVSLRLIMKDETGRTTAARTLLDHLAKTDPFPFFQVVGVWVFAADGRLLATAGGPVPASDTAIPSLSAETIVSGSEFAVLPPVGGTGGGVLFATIVSRVADPEGSPGLVVAVHTVSINSSAPYIPTSYWRTGNTRPPLSAPAEDHPEAKYHLEVVGPDGIAVLGIGEDERPGEKSRHINVIKGLMAEGKAATLLHKPDSGDAFEPHVMAVVPLAGSTLYVVLEQPVDVALALPRQIRQRLILLTTLGFLATLLVAWITTRHVVKPTEQLTVAAQRMAQGDLERPINVTAQDEVGKLAESLDAMRQRLRAAHQQVENTNRGLESQVRERTSRLGEVLGKIISSQEEERYRLARELHDETAQTLGALSIALDRAQGGLQDASPETVEQLTEAKAIANRLIEETRRLILDLRPMVLDDLGLGAAIRWYAESHLEEQGVTTNVEFEQPAYRISKHVEVSLFRIVQEAVNNIAKHAHAQHAHIRLEFRDSVATVMVSDDGKGFDVDRVLDFGASANSVGLLGMQERVRLLNGRLHIRSEQGKGTQVTVKIPITEGPA